MLFHYIIHKNLFCLNIQLNWYLMALSNLTWDPHYRRACAFNTLTGKACDEESYKHVAITELFKNELPNYKNKQ